MFNIDEFIAIFDKFKEKINEQPVDFAPSPEVTIINTYDFTKEIDKCHVCGDKSKCRYFDGISCKASRDFFKRSIKLKKQYKCREYNVCQVNKMTRNQCQACRFSKCLSIGMNLNNVMKKLQHVKTQKETINDLSPLNVPEVNNN